jgi:predicted kinase
MAGLPGTGKSTLARKLAKELGGVILDKDPIRACLFPAGEIEFSTEQDDFVVDVMLKVSGYLFRKDANRIIILDGRPFNRQYQILRVDEFARANGASFRLICCTCTDEIARTRLSRGGHLAANRDFNLYLRMKAEAEPLPLPHLLVDTGQGFDKSVALALEYLRG